MVVSDEAIYKQKIGAGLIATSDIVTLLNNKEIVLPQDLINKNIFSYIKIPNQSTTIKNYICFDYNSSISRINDVFKNVVINMLVICHESEMHTVWGNRHDILTGVITDAFNWSNVLGYQVKLISNDEKVYENDYHGRMLQFRNLAPNSLENGVKINGNR